MPDTYTLQARRLPVAAVALPPIILAGAGVITTTGLGVASGLVLAVIAAVAGQLGRDKGKHLEPALWASWGGPPTLRRLRFRDASDAGRTERLHARVESITGDTLPTVAEESTDRRGADARYEEAAARIRALTRDKDRFPLLFAENVNYGMRRNLLGLRREGIAFAVLTILVGGSLLAFAHGTLSERAARFGPGIGAALIAIVFWVVVVRPVWVKLTAEAYADQVVGAVDVLSAG
jgi:hypothetical protein